jgi:tetratricopeptide (TPR) repeat protein
MIQEFEYIDSYFKGLLSDEEMKIFDQKIISEPDFAEDVAFYLTAQNAARDLAHKEKISRFRQLQPSPTERPGRVIKVWAPYAAAAAVIGAIALIAVFYFNNPSPANLAHEYVEKNFADLSVSMGTPDSAQDALGLYNAGKLDEALRIYEKQLQKDATNPTILNHAGMAALGLKQYDKALHYFQRLANIQLHANPGKFHSAITLMERNKPGDLQEAKKLLQNVVDDNLEGSETAAQWLKEL